MTDRRVTRDDIERKAQAIVDVVEETKDSAMNSAVLAAVGIVVAVAVAFWLGKRRGKGVAKAAKTLVEVYRVS